VKAITPSSGFPETLALPVYFEVWESIYSIWSYFHVISTVAGCYDFENVIMLAH
jgi:hypothetical protein